MNTETKSATGSNVLWAAVGALSVAVIALGAMLYTKSPPSAPQAVTAPAMAPAVVTPASAPAEMPAAPAAVAQPPAKATAKPATGTSVGGGTAAPKGAAPAPAAATPAAATPAATAPAKTVCANCATVTAVTPVEREGQPTGAGAVAGGVLGAVVGNQFGGGDGKTVTTILGAVGGGMAGNEVEKRMKKVTVYQVHLRMDDGGTRTMELASPVSVGARVRVEGSTLQPL